jgi:hypothetical protein
MSMRTATTFALAAIGVLGLVPPCAAQSGPVSLAQNSVSVSKSRLSPQRLSPPESPAAQGDKMEREDVAPAPVPPQRALVRTEPIRPAAPERTAPQHLYTRPALTPPPVDYPPAQQAASTQGSPAEFSSAERLLDWISNYRDRPQYWRVPAAVHAMRDHRLFEDQEQRWFCAGFIAGVLGTNPKDGPGLIPKMFPMPPKEQEVIIRAIAYSGRPDWQDLLTKNADKMPLRKPLIDDFLNGRRPTLQKLDLELGGAQAVYAHWGYYVASGQYEPVVRIMQALKWSKGADEKSFFGKLTSGWGSDASNVDRVTTGGTAKWTLASYAERDRDLISLYRSEIPKQPEEVAKPLKDVIKAAELFEAEKIRKEQYGAIEDAERTQLTSEAGMSKGMTAGSIAIATGCMAATALGQPQIAVPCVIGGALYSGAAKLSH